MTELGDPALTEIIKILQAPDDEIANAERKALLTRIERTLGRYLRGNGYWVIDIDQRDPNDAMDQIEELLDLLSDCREELRDD